MLRPKRRETPCTRLGRCRQRPDPEAESVRHACDRLPNTFCVRRLRFCACVRVYDGLQECALKNIMHGARVDIKRNRQVLFSFFFFLQRYGEREFDCDCDCDCDYD